MKKKRPRKDVHPMHVYANLPKHMTKRARKLLAKRRREIAEEDQDPICDKPDDEGPINTNAELGFYHANHRGTLLRRWDGCIRRINLGLNEDTPYDGN